MNRQSKIRCTSEPALALLGRIPPRTPGRSDAQAPSDQNLGEAKAARFPHVYFYDDADPDDAVFGLLDMEVSLQLRRDGSVWLEIYCTGDGYQSGYANGADHPFLVEVRSDHDVLAGIRWPYPDVLCGHFDPLTFACKTQLTARQYAEADRIYLARNAALAGSCKGALPVMGGPDGH